MTPLLRFATRAVPPLAFLISMSHLLHAHESPGDGFTAGVILSLGLTLQYVSFGHDTARRMVRPFRFEFLLLGGLAVAIAAALLPLLVGDPLLAELAVSVGVPVFGTAVLTRAFLFDLGVFLLVLGGSMTIIDRLEVESE